MTRLPRLAAALVLSVVAALLAPVAAHAVGYQFWGFYQLSDDGEWGFATEGPATTVPADGAVEGYRFAVSSGEDVRVPRDVLTFDEICAQTPPEDGMKRVAVVVDPGRDVDAPEGEALFAPGAQCVVAETGATSLEVLDQAAGEIRTGDGRFLCGIGGFPTAGGCGDEVAEPTPEQLADDEEIEIPVVPAGEPIIAAADQGGGATDEPAATDDPTTTDDATTDDATTDDETAEDAATDEATTEDATEDATTGEETEEDTAAATPDEGTDEESGESGGVPPWVWIAGAVVLLGLLVWAAGAARNRRLEEAERDWSADGDDDPRTDGPQHG